MWIEWKSKRDSNNLRKYAQQSIQFGEEENYVSLWLWVGYFVLLDAILGKYTPNIILPLYQWQRKNQLCGSYDCKSMTYFLKFVVCFFVLAEFAEVMYYYYCAICEMHIIVPSPLTGKRIWMDFNYSTTRPNEYPAVAVISSLCISSICFKCVKNEENYAKFMKFKLLEPQKCSRIHIVLHCF